MASDFPLGESLTDSCGVFYLPDKSRPEGTIILGQNGFGKSSAILRMVQHDRKEGVGSIVIDPKGDLAERLAAAGDEKTILITVDEVFPFGINPYEVVGDKSAARNVDRTVNNVVNLFKKVFGDSGFHPQIELVVRNSARMICANDLTMAEVPFIFGSEAFRAELMQKVKYKDQVEGFWKHWQMLRSFERARLVEPLLTRLDAFLGQEWLYRVLSQRHTTIPFDKVFKEGYTLLLKLPREDEELTSFLGAIIVSLLSQAVWRQNEVPEKERKPTRIYIDEYSHFGSSSTTAMFFKEARFLNIGTLASLQVLSDIKDIAHREALMNAGSLILFQLTGNDAQELVKNLTVPAEEPKIDPRVFVITREPLEHIRRFGHRDPDIEKMAELYLRPLEDAIIQAKKEFEDLSSYQQTRCAYNKKFVLSELVNKRRTDVYQLLHIRRCNYAHIEDLKDGEKSLNALLFDSMTHPINWVGSPDWNRQLTEIIEYLQALIGVHGHRYPPDFNDRIMLPEPLKTAILADLNDPGWFNTYKLRETLQAEYQDHDFYLNYETVMQHKTQIAKEISTYLDFRLAGLKTFEQCIKNACLALAKPENKINLPTGEIDLELLGKQVKSFADRKGELAVKLATLPRYQAYCQTHGATGVPQEGIVRLYAPVPPPGDWLKMAQITQNSRQYTRRWEEVEQEIENRQAVIRATLQTTPPPKKTPDEPDTHPWVSRSEIFYPQ